MKARVTKSKQKLLNSKKWIEYLTLSLLSMLIIGAPLSRGLFFQKEILISHVVSFSIFTLYIAHKYKNKEKITLFNSPYDLVGLFFILAYFLPIATWQWVNLRDSIGMLIRHINYFVIYLIVKDMIRNNSYKKIIMNALTLSSLLVALVGVLGSTGYINLADVVLGNRISSTFQYPNTLAALMMSMLFVTTGIMSENKKTLNKIVYGAIGFILLFTFIFTYSRAAWMLLPIFMLVYILIIPSIERINTLLYFVSIAVANLIILQPFTTYSNVDSATKPKALLTFFAGLVCFIILYRGIIFIQEKLQNKQIRAIYGLLVIILIVGIGISYIALTTFEPIIFDNANISENRLNQIQRTIGSVEASKTYTLHVVLDSVSMDEGQWPWRIHINSIDNQKNQELLVERVGSESESGIIEILFKTLEDTKALNIFFTNTYAGTKVSFEEALLMDEDGEVINSVKLKYRFIPEALVTRVSSITILDKSSIARLTYYKDSFTIFKNNSIFGSGGGAWLALYPQYQSEAYISTEAHNLFLQTLVETGALGVLTLLALIVLLLRDLLKNIKEKNTFRASLLLAILSLIVHSGLDFNFSFHSIPIFLWLMIGILDSDILTIRKSMTKLAALWNKKYSTFILLCVGAVLLLSSVALMSASLIEESIKKAINEVPLLDSINKQEKAVKLDPSNSRLRLDLVKMMRFYGERSGEYKWVEDAEKQILKALEFDAHSQTLLKEASNYYINIGNFEKGFDYADRVIGVAPLNQSSYEFKSEVYRAVSDFYMSIGSANQALEVNANMLKIIDEIKVANKRITKTVQLNSQTLDTIFRSRYYLENFDKPEELSKLSKMVYISYLDLEGNTGFDRPWNKWGPVGTQIKYDFTFGGITVYNAGTARGIVYSPSFNLSENKNYQVEILLSNNSLDQIRVDVSSLGKTPDVSMVIDQKQVVNGKYVFEFSTKGILDDNIKSIIFYHPGNSDKHFTIKRIMIREVSIHE